MEFVKTYDNVLSTELCNNIISRFNSDETKSFDGITGRGIDITVKHTTDYMIDGADNRWSEIDNILSSTLTDYLNIYKNDLNSICNEFPYPVLRDTGFQIQRYTSNCGFYKQHHDFGHAIVENNQIYNRIITYLFYLNDVVEGGETGMLNIHKITPKTGKLLIFPATWTYQHCGNMPISNDKYIITGWGYSKTSSINPNNV